jgi:hypothetical protein
MILDRVQAGHDAHQQAVKLEGDIVLPEKAGPCAWRDFIVKGDAVVNRPDALWIEASGGQHVTEIFGHGHVVADVTQGHGVDEAIGKPFGQAVQIIEPWVAVDGGDKRNARESAQDEPDEIALRAVRVQQIARPLADDAQGAPDLHREQLPGDAVGVDAHGGGFIMEGTVPEADQGHVKIRAQCLDQGQHMAFRAAFVAAADEMDYPHVNLPHRLLHHAVLVA